MKTIIVISDSHCNREAVEKLRPLIAENDYVIHLGDGANDMNGIYVDMPEKVFVCKGNCDSYAPIAKDEGTLQVEDCKLFFCHGDKYRVKTELETLAQKAKTEGCNIALYGHTHEARIDTIDGITLINPGTLSRYTTDNSYAYLIVNGEKCVAKIVNCNF